jgi:carboxylate-amine ligase
MKITFNGSPAPTLGVEVELQLLDPETKNLVSGAPRIIERMAGPTHIKPELIESTIELNTDVCRDVSAVRQDLRQRIGELLAVCDELGYEVASAGTHPFAEWSEQRVTPKERYTMLVDRCQWPARRLMIFGLHVHVGVESGEKAIAVFNSLTTYLPHLLSLSASSPFFADADTGLASCRVKIFESLPTAGLPYRFRNWAEFQRLMITLVNARAIESVREIWWDIRPHPDFGTIEVRICDGLPTLNDVIAMTALVQALIVWLGDQYDSGRYLPGQRHWIVRENKWRAARWAVDADIIVDEEGGLERLSDSILGLVETLTPTAQRLESSGELARIAEMLRVGPSYRRQRRVHAEAGSFDAVMDALVREFRENAAVLA